MATFFTADTHFGHANIINYSNRPFATVEEMNETLIRSWNSTVSPEDCAYILGDFAYRSAKPIEEYLKRLNGEKHLLSGNHERSYFNTDKGLHLHDYWLYEGNYKE